MVQTSESENAGTISPSTGRRLLHCSILVAATIVCLLPFSGRAFYTDDPLFIWTAQQITHHPLDPYGFGVSWADPATTLPMSQVTQNPPLASYYMAGWAKFVGWSERALHLVFFLPTIMLVLGVYRLAGRFMRSPLLAVFAALLTPALLVSACSTMCDLLMLAFWIWAAILWIDGLEKENPLLLTASALLIALAELTKYFGAALIPLLVVYTVARNRRISSWAWYLLVPVAVLIGYEVLTTKMYGHGLLSTAMRFSKARRISTHASKGARALIGFSYTGGCVLPAIFLTPLLWSRKQIAIVLLASAAAAALMMRGFVRLGVGATNTVEIAARNQHWAIISPQLIIFIAGGISCLALAISDYRRKRDADSLFLVLWVIGTFWFAAFLNWTMNARSILPMVPAVGILIARRLESFAENRAPRSKALIAFGLLLSGVVSLWLVRADSEQANAARTAAYMIHERTVGNTSTLWFTGHSGFQYYMQQLGAHPYDWWHPGTKPGDFIAFPYAKVWPLDAKNQFPGPREDFSVPIRGHASTNCPELSAGFYYSYWSILPYVFGPVPEDKYAIVRLGQ
jgi:Dolichyl-phosphate-mannose-protein mannosyltransferase